MRRAACALLVRDPRAAALHARLAAEPGHDVMVTLAPASRHLARAWETGCRAGQRPLAATSGEAPGRRGMRAAAAVVEQLHRKRPIGAPALFGALVASLRALADRSRCWSARDACLFTPLAPPRPGPAAPRLRISSRASSGDCCTPRTTNSVRVRALADWGRVHTPPCCNSLPPPPRALTGARTAA